MMDLIQKSIQNCDSAFLYQLLDRMKSDCQYYFGNGRIYGAHLWGREEKRHITYMKEIWEAFSSSEKPEWLTYEDILAYERRLDSRYKLQQDVLDEIASELGLFAWRPCYHSDARDKNTVLFYSVDDFRSNQEISLKLATGHEFYTDPSRQEFKPPLFVFENSDAKGNLNYDYACMGAICLSSSRWRQVLMDRIRMGVIAEKRCQALREEVRRFRPSSVRDIDNGGKSR
mgnify:FL=1